LFGGDLNLILNMDEIRGTSAEKIDQLIILLTNLNW